MGSGRDKRKKQKGKTPGGGDAKTSKKTEHNAAKAERRAERKAQVTDAVCVCVPCVPRVLRCVRDGVRHTHSCVFRCLCV